MRHMVIRPDDRPWTEVTNGPGGGGGLCRQVLIDQACGSVHMTLGWGSLVPGGEVSPQAHSFEKTIFVVAGDLQVACGGLVYQLGPDDYTLIPLGRPYALASNSGARWLEVLAPQAREHPRDTFAVGEMPDWGRSVVPDWRSPLRGEVGHFTEEQLPPPSQLQMEGYSGGDVTGIRLKMLVDKVFGAQHMNVFMVEFQPGGAGNLHDHPFEEAYVFISGAAEAVLDGQRYQLNVGDVVWTGVGGVHGFFPTGDQPVRWIEVQAPQPPAQHAFRFVEQWAHVEAHGEARGRA